MCRGVHAQRRTLALFRIERTPDDRRGGRGGDPRGADRQTVPPREEELAADIVQVHYIVAAVRCQRSSGSGTKASIRSKSDAGATAGVGAPVALTTDDTDVWRTAVPGAPPPHAARIALPACAAIPSTLRRRIRCCISPFPLENAVPREEH